MTAAVESILYTVEDHIATLTLNRPEKLNAFDVPMLDLWVSALQRAQDDADVRVIIVTGAGRGFCTGGDISIMGNNDVLSEIEIKNGFRDGVHRIPRMLARMDKPVIAAVNGLASGAGLDLALMCDLRFAAASAKMGETYARMGLLPGAGGGYFLPRIVGVAKALEMFWGTEMIDAAEALRIGLVNRVFPDDQLMKGTLEFAARVAATAPLAIQMVKRTVYQSAEADLETSLDLISSHMIVTRKSRDHAEAVAAYKDKRPPKFEGR